VAEETIFPLAQDEGIAVMVYLPFGRSRMWAADRRPPLPEWAAEFDATTWAQFMLKFVVAHPAVTVAAPGTGNPEHMVDNLGGAAAGSRPRITCTRGRPPRRMMRALDTYGRVLKEPRCPNVDFPGAPSTKG
jgi:predicted aldo/keto reductase-like oxidoreductase